VIKRDIMFDKFMNEINKYDSGVHRLNAAASEMAIARAEMSLGISFPQEYRMFLSCWNGGLLFAKEFFDIIIWNLEEPGEEWKGEYNFDVVKSNEVLVSEQRHPRHLIAVASYSDGNLLCLDITRQGKPVLWLRDEKEIEEEWSTFEEWLEHEMEEGATLYDYQGNEKESGGKP
jgi:cell wall assembly regulator SMI1